MGWASGSGLMSEIIREVKSTGVDFESRKEVYEVLIHCFEDHDCDTLQECVGEDIAFDAVWEMLYPEPADEEEET